MLEYHILPTTHILAFNTHMFDLISNTVFHTSVFAVWFEAVRVTLLPVLKWLQSSVNTTSKLPSELHFNMLLSGLQEPHTIWKCCLGWGLYFLNETTTGHYRKESTSTKAVTTYRIPTYFSSEELWGRLGCRGGRWEAGRVGESISKSSMEPQQQSAE